MFRSTRQQRDHTTAGAIISEYSLVGEVTSGAAAVLDDPTYAGVSNNQCLHLENAVTRGGDTAYSKLKHTQLATTAQTPSAEYSWVIMVTLS